MDIIKAEELEDGYERLINAIVLQAVKDYRGVLKRLEKYPDNSEALWEKRKIEQFFRSRWFATLTTIDPEILIEALQIKNSMKGAS